MASQMGHDSQDTPHPTEPTRGEENTEAQFAVVDFADDGKCQVKGCGKDKLARYFLCLQHKKSYNIMGRYATSAGHETWWRELNTCRDRVCQAIAKFEEHQTKPKPGLKRKCEYMDP